MKAFALADLLASQASEGRAYLEFLREQSLSAGLYVLPAGDVDRQSPHSEDEVYVVLSGSGLFTAGDETRSVRDGDTLFVGAGVPHRFHDISEELRVIVVFAPPEYSRQSG
jgi:mannose-6-phosphate isomerase-like protein (cupin superfamily)